MKSNKNGDGILWKVYVLYDDIEWKVRIIILYILYDDSGCEVALESPYG